MSANTPDRERVDLLDRIAVQDKAALNHLYEHAASRLYGLALRVVGNKEWAEDVLQESFLGIWRTAGSYRASLSPPMAWISCAAFVCGACI